GLVLGRRRAGASLLQRRPGARLGSPLLPRRRRPRRDAAPADRRRLRAVRRHADPQPAALLLPRPVRQPGRAHQHPGRLPSRLTGVLGLAIAPWEIVLRSVLIYLALLVALRLFGKREVGQFTLYDMVLILLVANAVQPAMTGPDNSLVGGVIIIAALVVLNFVIGRLDRFGLFHRLLEPEPTIVVRNGRYLERNL